MRSSSCSSFDEHTRLKYLKRLTHKWMPFDSTSDLFIQLKTIRANACMGSIIYCCRDFTNFKCALKGSRKSSGSFSVSWVMATPACFSVSVFDPPRVKYGNIKPCEYVIRYSMKRRQNIRSRSGRNNKTLSNYLVFN